jgi:molybdopterin-guanine dinucleotide biosynthesis protein A
MSAGVAILAGGEATRLPGKLGLAAGDVPLLVRTLRNVSRANVGGREMAIACRGSFEPQLDAQLPVTLVVDRWSGRGPLAGLLTAFAALRSRRVFAVAGDAPHVDARFVETLERAWRDGDEALVPSHRRDDGREQLEPLCALYDRLAVLREGFALLRSGNGSLHALLERLRTRVLPHAPSPVFTNLNTPADYAAFRTGAVRETA